MSTVISAEHVSKTYRLGSIGGSTLNEDLARWWAAVRGRPDPLQKVDSVGGQRRHGQIFHALRDVSFTVSEGEVLGVIGRNGAGKSTLLKILSRVTAPSGGQIRLRGRVASLLEVGTGFHPDLSGRENVYLNGAILGMTRSEIRAKFDEIVAFSECEAFIDTPVKRYSSGMYVRLAFAVAAHLEPEILIVDEVLAVGDAQFQRKCLGKMGEVSRGGRTVLFVSHNMLAVQSLCRSAVLLNDGRVEVEGPAAGVVSAYLGGGDEGGDATVWDRPADAPGNEALRVHSIQVNAERQRDDGLIGMDSPIRIETHFWVLVPDVLLHVTYHLVSDEGITVLTTSSVATRRPEGLYQATFLIPGSLLNSGGYRLRFFLVQNENRVVATHEDIATFRVVETTERKVASLAREPGVVQPPLPWTEVQTSPSRLATAR